MTCPNCHIQNKDTAHFCRSCGTKLQIPESVPVAAAAEREVQTPPLLPGTEAPPEMEQEFPAPPVSYPDYPEELPAKNGDGLFGLLIWIHVVILFGYLLQHYVIPTYYKGSEAAAKWQENAGYITEGITILFLVILMVKVKNNNWKLGLFMFLVIRAGIGCFEYTTNHKAAGVADAVKSEEVVAPPAPKKGKKAKTGNVTASSSSGGPYAIADIKGYLYYNANNTMGDKRVIGKLSDNIIDNNNLDLRNVIIGGGDAEGVSNQTMVVVDITGDQAAYVARKIRLTVTTSDKQVFKQTQDLAIVSDDGKYKAAFLLYETGDVPITLKAQIINTENGKEIVESSLTKNIEFYLGE